MAACISEELLERYPVGGLSESERLPLEEHAAACESCRMTLAALGLAFSPGSREEEALIAWLAQSRPVDALLADLGFAEEAQGDSPQRATTSGGEGRVRVLFRRHWRSAVSAATGIAAGLLLLVATGQPPSSLDLPARSVAARPSSAESWVPLSTVRGSAAEVEAEFVRAEGEALARRKNDPVVAASQLAAVYIWRGQRGDLERAAEELLRVEGSTALHNDRGALAYANGDLRVALDHFEAALREEPRNAAALFNRALVLGELGRVEDAVAAWDHYLDAAPADDAEWLAEGRLRRAELLPK